MQRRVYTHTRRVFIHTRRWAKIVLHYVSRLLEVYFFSSFPIFLAALCESCDILPLGGILESPEGLVKLWRGCSACRTKFQLDGRIPTLLNRLRILAEHLGQIDYLLKFSEDNIKSRKLQIDMRVTMLESWLASSVLSFSPSPSAPTRVSPSPTS